MVIQPKFSEAQSFSEGLAPVKVGGGNWDWGFIDKTGRFVIQPEGYYSVWGFAEGLAAVCLSSYQCGFINKAGEMVIQPKYTDAFAFSDGLAKVKVGDGWGKWYFIDKTGTLIMEDK